MRAVTERNRGKDRKRFLYVPSKIEEITGFWCANGSYLVDRKTDGVELGRNNRVSILSTGEGMGLSGFGLEHRR